MDTLDVVNLRGNSKYHIKRTILARKENGALDEIESISMEQRAQDFEWLIKQIDDYIKTPEGKQMIEEQLEEWRKQFVHINDLDIGDKELFQVQ